MIVILIYSNEYFSFREMTPTAFSIGVIIAIINPGVIVLVVMFTSFLARRKGSHFYSQKKVKRALSGLLCLRH